MVTNPLCITLDMFFTELIGSSIKYNKIHQYKSIRSNNTIAPIYLKMLFSNMCNKPIKLDFKELNLLKCHIINKTHICFFCLLCFFSTDMVGSWKHAFSIIEWYDTTLFDLDLKCLPTNTREPNCLLPDYLNWNSYPSWLNTSNLVPIKNQTQADVFTPCLKFFTIRLPLHNCGGQDDSFCFAWLISNLSHRTLQIKCYLMTKIIIVSSLPSSKLSLTSFVIQVSDVFHVSYNNAEFLSQLVIWFWDFDNCAYSILIIKRVTFTVLKLGMDTKTTFQITRLLGQLWTNRRLINYLIFSCNNILTIENIVDILWLKNI